MTEPQASQPAPNPAEDDFGADDATSAGDIIAAGAIPQDALAAKLEALLFVHSRPVAARRLAELVGITSVIPVKQALDLLTRRYAEHGSAFTLQNLAGGYQLTTRPEHDALLNQLVREREAQKLSPATLEALAIIAYKQPIIRAQIEAIRGVACGEVLRSLIERHLIKIVGRAEELGRPILYGTTKTFLEVFGLASLDDLPKAEEFKAGLANPQPAKPAPPQANT